MIKIKYTNPNQRIEGQEKRSKLIDPDSILYKECQKLQDKLTELYPNLIADKRMDFHTELVFRGEEYSSELLVDRAQKLEGIEMKNLTMEPLGPNALVINTPLVDGRQPHITIGFFRQGIPSDWKEKMEN